MIFSHGSGGQPQFYSFFTEHLASWGFVVVAPPHPGNTSADCFGCDSGNIIASARERPSDVTFVLNQTLAIRDNPSEPLHAIIDPDRAGIAGHSFGGWTALFVAPGGPFDAVVALAPGEPQLLIQRDKTAIVPILLIGAGLDRVVPEASVRKLWDALPTGIERTYVSLPLGTHLSFVDRCADCTAGKLPQARGQSLINAYTTAFLMTYLYGDARYGTFLQQPELPDALLVEK